MVFQVVQDILECIQSLRQIVHTFSVNLNVLAIETKDRIFVEYPTPCRIDFPVKPFFYCEIPGEKHVRGPDERVRVFCYIDRNQ